MLSATKRKITATIANGTALSDVLDMDTEFLAGMIVHAAWTAAAITFQGSTDGANFFNVYDEGGTEVSIASASVVADRFISFSDTFMHKLRACQYLKLRSGTAATPVNQLAARTISVIGRQL